jgi:hypothetical protein
MDRNGIGPEHPDARASGLQRRAKAGEGIVFPPRQQAAPGFRRGAIGRLALDFHHGD